MTERQNAKRGWFARWREHRRAKGQQAIERATFERERARSSGGAYSTSSAYQHGAPAAGWTGFGGDGGGCGGDGGGC
ncbi:MAG: hypothetical protein WKF94_19605 [Solirubrobacteraceae bacterium]